MRDDYPFPKPGCETRRHFLGTVASAAASAVLIGTVQAAEQVVLPPTGKWTWSRLIARIPRYEYITESFYEIQSEAIRSETHLGFETKIHAVDLPNLKELCKYPFCFTGDLKWRVDPQDWKNVRDYLYQGGFFYTRLCYPRLSAAERLAFAAEHLARLKRVLPGCEVVRLWSNHAIFQAPFLISDNAALRKCWDPNGSNPIYGIFDADRMVALLDMAGLWCGQPSEVPMPPIQSRLIANIYVFAVSH